jgi:hypothetical protein
MKPLYWGNSHNGNFRLPPHKSLIKQEQIAQYFPCLSASMNGGEPVNYEMLERYEGKLSRTVLRRGGASNRLLLSLRNQYTTKFYRRVRLELRGIRRLKRRL